jgi:hypothetical protein
MFMRDNNSVDSTEMVERLKKLSGRCMYPGIAKVEACYTIHDEASVRTNMTHQPVLPSHRI